MPVVLHEYGALTRDALRGHLPSGDPRTYLYDLLSDYPKRGGKMMRSSLCLATARAFGAALDDALCSAVSIELLHNALLIHDDIQDGSEERRGRPALHHLHGIPLALNAGDTLSLLSLRPLKENMHRMGPRLAMRILEETERTAWESAEGQALELGWRRDNRMDVSDADYLAMALKKTCWLAAIHPVRVGALIGTRGDVDPEQFVRFGFFLGAAFQIQDDVLNLTANRGYGKERDGDIWEGKRTLMLIHTWRESSSEERQRMTLILATPRERRAVQDVAWIRAQMDRMRSAGLCAGRRPRPGRRGAARVRAHLRRVAGLQGQALRPRARHLGPAADRLSHARLPVKRRLLIYGVTGYTGRLVAEQAKGLDAVLAGRDAARVEEVARSAGLERRIVGLERPDQLDRALQDIAVVLNVAGPFVHTAEPLVRACLRTGTHYLDISGELESYRRLDNYHSWAYQRRVMLMPGVGFSVLTSDLLVATLYDQLLPEANAVRIALSPLGMLSRGSVRTALESVREGVVVRRNGRMQTVPAGQLERTFSFGAGDFRVCTAISLPDAFTVRYTTAPKLSSEGVPNVEAYVEAGAFVRALYQAANWFALPARLWPFNWILRSYVAALPEGPLPGQREQTRHAVVVEAENHYRERAYARLETQDSYDFTAKAAIVVATLALEGAVKPGFRTPASVYYQHSGLQKAFAEATLAFVAFRGEARRNLKIAWLPTAAYEHEETA